MIENKMLVLLAEVLEQSALFLRRTSTLIEKFNSQSEYVSVLELSVRSRKALRQLGINTIFELCQTTSDQLMDARNFGDGCLEEIREQLKLKSLSLAGEERCDTSTRNPSRASR